MRDDKERLKDIEEAIERIEKYASKGKKAFQSDELIQSWIVRHLQIIGEATRSLSSDCRDKYCGVVQDLGTQTVTKLGI